MEEKRKILIAPSILSADFSRLGEEIRDVEAAGCDWIHVDVMDGHFVPNLTIGPVVIKSIRRATKLPFDVHLMIDDPIQYVEEFAKAGSDWITFHVEATNEVDETLARLDELGVKKGLSLKPDTSVERIKPYLDQIDLVLIMSVEPGFGGQEFMPKMMDKVKELRSKFKGLISVDGGVNAETAGLVRKAGADVIVAGSAIYRAPDRKKAIKELRG